MNHNIKYIAGMMLMLGVLLMVGTNVFASHFDFRSNLTKSERIALEKEENRALQQHELLKKKYTEDFVNINENHETCNTKSLRAHLSIAEGIALRKSEDKNLSYLEAVGMENTRKRSNLAMQDESCFSGSVRKGLDKIELTILEQEERNGK